MSSLYFGRREARQVCGEMDAKGHRWYSVWEEENDRRIQEKEEGGESHTVMVHCQQPKKRWKRGGTGGKGKRSERGKLVWVGSTRLLSLTHLGSATRKERERFTGLFFSVLL